MKKMMIRSVLVCGIIGVVATGAACAKPAVAVNVGDECQSEKCAQGDDTVVYLGNGENMEIITVDGCQFFKQMIVSPAQYEESKIKAELLRVSDSKVAIKDGNTNAGDEGTYIESTAIKYRKNNSDYMVKYSDSKVIVYKDSAVIGEVVYNFEMGLLKATANGVQEYFGHQTHTFVKEELVRGIGVECVTDKPVLDYQDITYAVKLIKDFIK